LVQSFRTKEGERWGNDDTEEDLPTTASIKRGWTKKDFDWERKSLARLDRIIAKARKARLAKGGLKNFGIRFLW
jgi:hypothetical protein